MYRVRRWVVRHAGWFDRLYRLFEPVLVRLDPIWRRIGYGRLEAPIAQVEARVKGLLFDCRMCGQCSLGSTGMACPMNCPKQLRNGPCGGVRPDGRCEVKPEMACVWVDAWEGSQRMVEPATIFRRQPPVDRTLDGHSSWLRVARAQAASTSNGSVSHAQRTEAS